MYAEVYTMGTKLGTSITTLILQIISGGVLYILLCLIYMLIDKQNCIHQYYLSKILKRRS